MSSIRDYFEPDKLNEIVRLDLIALYNMMDDCEWESKDALRKTIKLYCNKNEYEAFLTALEARENK